jgi:hypothetical protein
MKICSAACEMDSPLFTIHYKLLIIANYQFLIKHNTRIPIVAIFRNL